MRLFIEEYAALNFIANGAALFLTAHWHGRHKNYRLIMLSSLIGTAYAIGVMQVNEVWLLPLHVAVAMLMVHTSLLQRSSHRSIWMRLVLTFALVQLSFAAVWYVIAARYPIHSTLNTMVIIIMFTLIMYVYRIRTRQRALQRENLVPITIVLASGQRWQGTALVDSGLTLREPSSGTEVIFISHEVELDLVEEQEITYMAVNTVASTRQYVALYRTAQVVIGQDVVRRVHEDVWLARAQTALSTQSHAFQALIPPELVRPA